MLLFTSSCQRAARSEYTAGTDRKPLEVRAEVDKARVTIGEIFTLTVTVDRAAEIKIEPPDFSPLLKEFQIVEITRPEVLEADARKVRVIHYRLKADKVGSYRVPALKISYALSGKEGKESARTSQLFIEVVSSLEGLGEITDLPNDIRPPADIIIRYWKEAAMGSAALLIILAAWVAFAISRKKKVNDAPAPPAHETALKELARLKEVNITDPMAARGLYFRISEVMRRYLEERFRFPAIDRTTEEIQPFISQSPEIDKGARGDASTFFVNTDRVKFAKYIPDHSDVTGEFEIAEGFIHKTKKEAPKEAASARNK